MKIEEEVFKRYHVDFTRLVEYGFECKDNGYKYVKKFFDDQFAIEVVIDNSGKLSSKVIDLDFNEEYGNINIKNSANEFVNRVKEEYKQILINIRDNCFIRDYFIYNQSNRITCKIIEKYGDYPEFLWEKFPGIGVFRNKGSNKWYAFIMNVDKSKIASGEGEVEAIDIKVDEKNIESLINRPGYYKGYHMNKKSWITIILDDSVSDEEIFNLIEKANQSVSGSREWIVPANASYFDVIGYFNSHKVVDWKQTSDIRVNDFVYIYVGAPYSCLMYKCKAVKVGLPYSYKDSNVKMDYIMKLEVLGKYDNDKYTFNKLKELGIGAIRGPRTITKALSDELNKKSDC